VTAYVDSSVLLNRYVAEPDSDRADALLAADVELVTGRSRPGCAPWTRCTWGARTGWVRR